MPSKKINQKYHAKYRAKERYGLTINKEKYQKLVEKIRSGKSISSEKQSNRITIHTLMFEDELVRVVYDKNRKTVVTFLPSLQLKESTK